LRYLRLGEALRGRGGERSAQRAGVGVRGGGGLPDRLGRGACRVLAPGPRSTRGCGCYRGREVRTRERLAGVASVGDHPTLWSKRLASLRIPLPCVLTTPCSSSPLITRWRSPMSRSSSAVSMRASKSLACARDGSALRSCVVAFSRRIQRAPGDATARSRATPAPQGGPILDHPRPK
jgi:hypothetical protein